MAFEKIEYSSWKRREIYEFFGGSTMYVTVKLDITDFLRKVKERGLRFYPAMIHCIARVINSREEYRYGKHDAGNIGLWDRIDPLYTVPRQDDPALFSMAVTRYQADFDDFYKHFLHDSAQAENGGRLLPDGGIPPNVMGVTAFFTSFEAFSFGGDEGKSDFTPFTVLGRYTEENGRILLPVCGEFSHAVNDGHHISQFFALLKEELLQF